MARWTVICLALALLPAGEAYSGDSKLGDMVMESRVEYMKKAGVGPVIYPHAKHEELFKCQECHPKIFKEKRGTNNLSMQNIMDGNSCGFTNCHNSVNVFPLYQCLKCHTKTEASR
jgi:c(7)-type cytochrome triheme protein